MWHMDKLNSSIPFTCSGYLLLLQILIDMELHICRFTMYNPFTIYHPHNHTLIIDDPLPYIYLYRAAIL